MPRLPGLLWLALALAPLGCTSPEDCTNEVDDDGDGLIDCDDCDCDGVCESEPCDGDCEEVCGDGADNDEDGATDCEDSDCDGDCPEDCDDGRDNDGDGLLDCEDGDCTDCEEEVCDDGLDDDADGMIDCADDDCWGNGCAATVATLKGGSASVNRTVVDFYHYGWDSMFYTVSGAKTTSFWFTAGEHLTLVAAGIDLSGTVVQYPTTGAAALCTWTVDHGNLMMLEGSSSGFYSGYGGHYPYFDNTISHFNLRRGNFLIGGACTLSTSGFLPQRLTIEPTYLGLPGEGLWYGGSATGLVVSSDTHRIDHHINPSYFKYYSTVNAAWNIPELLTSDPWVVHD